VESIPQVLRDNLSKADAETMKAKIEAAGGVCVVE
jgi:ribosomal protein L7/L12